LPPRQHDDTNVLPVLHTPPGTPILRNVTPPPAKDYFLPQVHSSESKDIHLTDANKQLTSTSSPISSVTPPPLTKDLIDRADSSLSIPLPPMRSPSSLRIESDDSFSSFFSVSPTSRLNSSPEIESHYFSDDDDDDDECGGWSPHPPSRPPKKTEENFDFDFFC